MKHTLKTPALLEVHTPEGVCIGGSQKWYSEKYRRMSGCGPTAAANLIWYLSQSRPELNNICVTGDVDSYKLLQNEMFTFVTPGMGGVNSPSIFTSGMLKYGKAHNVSLVPFVLEIPKPLMNRPDERTVQDFIMAALQSDCPVAFLNLSNGDQNLLESWHWVTIIGLDPDTMITCVSDQGRILDIIFSKWLKTSLLGGALVYFEVYTRGR